MSALGRMVDNLETSWRKAGPRVHTTGRPGNRTLLHFAVERVRRHYVLGLTIPHARRNAGSTMRPGWEMTSFGSVHMNVLLPGYRIALHWHYPSTMRDLRAELRNQRREAGL